MFIQAELKTIHTEMCFVRFVISNSGSNLDLGLPFLRSGYRVPAVVHSLEAPQSTWSAATQTDRSFSASPTSLESARAKKLEQRCNGLNCIWIETLAIPF